MELAKAIPISNNSPFVNVCVDGRFKIRGVIDTGSTTTIMSSGLYRLLDKLELVPTSTGFKGVNGRDQYDGILEQLSLQFTDKLKVTINVAVVPTEEIFLLIGSDCIGGAYAKLTRIAQADPHGVMVLQDAQGIQDVVNFIRNRERNELTVSRRVATVKPAEEEDLSTLFRA